MFSMSMVKIYSALIIASREMFKIQIFDDGDSEENCKNNNSFSD